MIAKFSALFFRHQVYNSTGIWISISNQLDSIFKKTLKLLFSLQQSARKPTAVLWKVVDFGKLCIGTLLTWLLSYFVHLERLSLPAQVYWNKWCLPHPLKEDQSVYLQPSLYGRSLTTTSSIFCLSLSPPEFFFTFSSLAMRASWRRLSSILFLFLLSLSYLPFPSFLLSSFSSFFSSLFPHFWK